jgi:hypothetical protein
MDMKFLGSSVERERVADTGEICKLSAHTMQQVFFFHLYSVGQFYFLIKLLILFVKFGFHTGNHTAGFVVKSNSYSSSFIAFIISPYKSILVKIL